MNTPFRCLLILQLQLTWYSSSTRDECSKICRKLTLTHTSSLHNRGNHFSQSLCKPRCSLYKACTTSR
ncbi:hypothetical protein M758_3G063400 [Ceratodon purpureus]|uniref:Secreted protein n=1 Tax=Ceratodon purpureus TaxID=3225 RepID=A0A8T0IIW2_CERPU|nr:hypothetical protein KC19_3G064100 [Ceratodon purpureus]KAG0621982.1 hypothetical protein M758_3G063400 [Ceratodon purpureus]